MRIGNILSTQRTGPYEGATSRITRLMLGLIAVTAFLVADGVLQAQLLHHSRGNPQIPEAGRWHVQTLSGDQPAQVATGKPVSFDDVFECASTACGGIQAFAHDSTICDPVDFENMSSGFVINGISGAFQFGVSGGFGDFFVYTFVGTLSEVHTVANGVTSLVSASITGTYGSTPGGCNNGLASDQGTFIATWYPPMAGTFYGVLVPVDVSEPAFGVELALTQGAFGGLTGTATTGRIQRLRDEFVFVPIQSACFDSTVLTINQGPEAPANGAAGDLFQVRAVDVAGNSLSLSGVATEIGSNSGYSVQYKISGGVCSGPSVNSAAFVSVTLPKATDRPALPPKARSVLPEPLVENEIASRSGHLHEE
jgi:hypothetical protein